MEGAPKKMTRRELLRNTLSGAIVLGSVVSAAERAPNPSQVESDPETAVDVAERVKSIARLESLNARYVIEYGRHNKMSTTEVLNDSDALVLEVISDFTSKEKVVGIVNGIAFERGQKMWHPYVVIMQEAFRRKKPIFFVDMVPSKELGSMGREQRIAEIIRSVETLTGGLLIGDSVRTPAVKETGRRSLLATGAKATLGTWLLSHIPEQVSGAAARSFVADTTPFEGSVSRRLEKSFGAINSTIHPETRTMVVDTRNVLIAQKTETVARYLAAELGRKPQIALEVGADHFGIERELLVSEGTRIQTLKDDLGDQFSEQGTIARVELVTDMNGQSKLEITLIQDPAMKERT